MKKLIPFIVGGLTVINSLSAQFDSTATNYITITGQYLSGQGVDLRWFPSNRSILALGLEKGYTVLRAEVPTFPTGALKFDAIQHVIAYNTPKWNTAIALKNSAGVANNLPDMAGDFSETVKARENSAIAITPQAEDLKDLKHEEANEHGSLMLTAIQDKETAIGLGIGTLDSTALSSKIYMYKVEIHKPTTTISIGAKAKSGTIISLAKAKAKLSEMEIISMETIVQTTPGSQPTNPSVKMKEGDGTLTIHWDEHPELVGYYIERSLNKNGGYEALNQAPILQVRGANYHGAKRGSFQDSKIQNERTYYYRISANTLFGDKIVVATVEGKGHDLTPPEAPFLNQPIHNKQTVDLEWEFLQNTPADLAGFKVYRSDNPNGPFVEITSQMLPAQTRTYSDNGYDSKSKIYYKVDAIDNNENVSSSLPVYALIIDDTPPSRPEGIIGNISNDGKVQIVIPRQKDDDIIGYKIFKANQEDHIFVVVKEFFPNAVDPKEVIAWQDSLQKANEDPDRPASGSQDQPQKNRQLLDKKPLNNKEENSRDPDKRDAQLQPFGIHDNQPIGPENGKFVFEENLPLDNLTPNVYYKVRTYDRNFNQSIFSETIELKKPDIVPPPRSVFQKIKVSPTGIDMIIARAKAKDFDRVELSRSNEDGEKWTTIHVDRSKILEGNLLRFTDDQIIPGEQYIYRLQTIDQTGLKSAFSYSGTVKSINASKVEEVNAVVAQQINKEVLISWQGPPSNDIYYVIYRSVANGSLRQIGRSSINQFKDRRPIKGNISYAVKRMHSDGTKSTMSDETTIVVN